MQSETIEAFIKDLPSIQPLTYKAIYPRRIIPPNGYMNPKYFVVTLWSQLRVGFESEMNMLPHVTGLVNCLLHMKYRVPTYFVRSEFAQAVSQTEPPDDFKLNEIKWPMPAMLFVLPTQFVMKYFGYHVPFLSITRSDKGIYPEMLTNLPPCDMPVSLVNPLYSEVDRLNVVYPVYSQKEAPVDYSGTYPLTMNANQMDDVPFEDATYLEEEKLFNASERLELRREVSGLPYGDDEKLFNTKVQGFAIKLMLLLTARPQMVKLGGVLRKMKIKKNVVKDELWNPNLVGWDYQPVRPVPTGEHGTHASPRMHWRRGFMRNQAHGPKLTLRKLMWIEPVLISAPDDQPETNETPETTASTRN